MSHGVKLRVPVSGDKIKKLCTAYDAVAGLYATCAYPGGGMAGMTTAHLRMPVTETARYESAIRRAMLDPCNSRDDFFHMIDDAGGGSLVERRLKRDLLEAFERRTKMPYDPPDVSAAGDHAGNTFCFARPFQMSNARNITAGDIHYPHADTGINQTTLAAVEYVPGSANFCFTALPGNAIKAQVPCVARLFYNTLSRQSFLPSLRGRAINVFVHTPVEFSRRGRDEFDLVHIEESSPKYSLISQSELPRMIDSLFCHAQGRVTTLVSQNPVYNDFRLFALRAM